MSLPMFDPSTPCPKCGYGTVGVQYQPEAHLACKWPCKDQKPERLERRCERCRFSWDEAVIDVVVDEPR